MNKFNSIGFHNVFTIVFSASPKEMYLLQKRTEDRLGIAVNLQPSMRPLTAISELSVDHMPNIEPSQSLAMLALIMTFTL